MVSQFIKKNYVLMLFFVSALIVLIVALVSLNLMRHSATMTEEITQEKMVGLSRAAALLVTADELDEFVVEEDMELPSYGALKERIIEFNDASATEFTYYLKLLEDEQMYQFIIDSDTEDPADLSAEPVAREEAPDLAISGQATAVPLGSYSEGWEGFLTAFAPVYYADGTPSNYLAGVDMIDSSIYQAYKDMQFMSVVLVVALLLVIGVSLACMLLYQRQARQAEAASESKTSFLSNMSHEMRTPLNAIIGMTEIARNTEDPERVLYCLNKVNVAAEHLLGVINDVLDISRIESGKFTLSPEEFKLEDMLRRVDSVVRFKTNEKKQDFVIEVDTDVPQLLCADEQHLSQVLTNLLANAVKFTPDEGKIRVKVSAEALDHAAVMLKVAVKDTGIGISEEQIKGLFTSFQQADNSISRRFGGTGLGLAISKSIVESMGGKIWVESTPGEGSTFFFTAKLINCSASNDLVTMAEQASGEDALTPQSIEGIFEGKTLLMAEDVELNQEVIIALLENTGVEIITAEDGEKAVALFKEDPKKYNAILMDIHMPNVDGYEATKRIRALADEWAQSIPIVAMTANVFREDIEKCLAAGMNDHLGKPIDMREVVTKLKHYLLS